MSEEQKKNEKCRKPFGPVRILKWIVKGVLAIIALVVVAVLTIPLWIGPVVTKVANKTVPEITKTEFKLAEFGLNPYTGKVHVGSTYLRNPAEAASEEGEGAWNAIKQGAADAVDAVHGALSGEAENALSFTAIDVKLKTASILSDTVEIDEIVIRDLSIYGDATFSNIRTIVKNVTESGEEKAESREQEAEEREQGGESEEGGGKQVVIHRLLLTGTKIKYGTFPTLELKDIEIRDIGKQDEPTDYEGTVDRIVDALAKAADELQTGTGTALKAAVDGGKKLGRGFMKLVDGTLQTVSDVQEAVGNAASKAKDAAGSAVDSVKNFGKNLNPFGGKDD